MRMRLLYWGWPPKPNNGAPIKKGGSRRLFYTATGASSGLGFGLRLLGFDRRQHIVGAHLEALFDARGLARQLAQVIELRAVDVAFALDFDRRDQRRIQLERTLDAFARRDFAHDE